MTYEYECKKGHRFEEQAKITDPPRKRCKVCRCKVHRLLAPGGFVLKGKGWAKDGYAGSR